MRQILIALALVFAVSACSDVETENTVPQSQREMRKNKNGRLTGDDGFLLMGKHKNDDASGALGVNSFLWRATLDTLSFMPLASADPFGGVIITDWYEDPQAPGERFKVNALILDKSLRSDGVKLTVFKQTKDKTGWRDQKVDTKLERSLEDTILTRARQLKVSQIK